jgi:hypothetical protein
VEYIHNLVAGALHLPEVECVKKDALEEHLHQLVRAGELDLSTRSEDIATDWIAADKKYFYTDRPLSLYSRLESVPLLRSPGATPSHRSTMTTSSNLDLPPPLPLPLRLPRPKRRRSRWVR